MCMPEGNCDSTVRDPFSTDGEAVEAQLGAGTSAAWIHVSPPSSTSPSSNPPNSPQEAAGGFLLQALGLRPQCSPRTHSSPVKERLYPSTGSRRRRPQTLTFAPSSYTDGGTGLWPPDQRSWKGGCQAEAPLGGGPSLAPKLSLPLPFPSSWEPPRLFPSYSLTFPLWGTHSHECRERTMSVCVCFRVPACCQLQRSSAQPPLWAAEPHLLVPRFPPFGPNVPFPPTPTYKSQKSPPGQRDSSC